MTVLLRVISARNELQLRRSPTLAELHVVCRQVAIATEPGEVPDVPEAAWRILTHLLRLDSGMSPRWTSD